jgi:hypothetical protein
LSDDESPKRPPFRLIQGGRREIRIGDARVAVASPSEPPFDVDAIVFEEDTFFVLSADPKVREPAEHPIKVWTAVHETEPAPLGSVVVRPGHPTRVLAVVHDLSQDPTCTEASIEQAFREIFRLSRHLEIESLGLPLLGTVHGKLPPHRALDMFRNALEAGPPETLERIWLITPAKWTLKVQRMFVSGEE